MEKYVKYCWNKYNMINMRYARNFEMTEVQAVFLIPIFFYGLFNGTFSIETKQY